MSGVGLKLSDVRFAYADWQVQFDMDVAPGWFVAVIGPSGAGKSTLLNLVAGFEQPSSGAILIDGEDVCALPPARRPVTMLFQDHNLFAHLDIHTNVALGISPALKLTAADRDRITAAFDRVGLSGLERRRPGELSGGQRQRAAIARALVRDKPLLLLDEPFAALGPALKNDMLDLVAEIHREGHMTVLMVSHDPQDARRAASHTVFLDEGGVVALDQTKALFARKDLAGLKAYLGA
ncbi:MAG: thiamine ABC transporter ATP-binding protein [Rhizobiales bacterium]|nr:thiamine ABC transporter ATP-binding protein [Hyphomicrobiales bacterium]